MNKTLLILALFFSLTCSSQREVRKVHTVKGKFDTKTVEEKYRNEREGTPVFLSPTSRHIHHLKPVEKSVSVKYRYEKNEQLFFSKNSKEIAHSKKTLITVKEKKLTIQI